MRVDQEGAGQLVGRAGELAQHQRAALVVAAGDVLLGHQVHPVPQRGHQHHVGGQVQRGHLLAGVGLVQVVDGRVTHLPVLPVDPAHRHLDLVAQGPVRLDPFPARARDLHQDHLRAEPALAEQLAVGPQPVQDALGVVEPVHPEQDDLGLAEDLPDFGGAFPDVLPLGDLGQGRRVDRDRERGRLDLARAARLADPHRGAPGGQARGAAAGPQEVRGVGPALEPQQVRAEQPLHHQPPPGQLGEDLIAGKGDVVEEPDADVAALLPQHPRDQLQLVVVHPDGRARRGVGRRGLREAPVDRDEGLPPPAVELRRRDDVVVERPQRRVAEALVEVPDLRLGQADPDQVQAIGLKRPRLGARIAGPADPRAAGLAHDGLEGGDQPAGTRPPDGLAARALDPVHRQPAGHYHEVAVRGRLIARAPG